MTKQAAAIAAFAAVLCAVCAAAVALSTGWGTGEGPLARPVVDVGLALAVLVLLRVLTTIAGAFRDRRLRSRVPLAAKTTGGRSRAPPSAPPPLSAELWRSALDRWRRARAVTRRWGARGWRRYVLRAAGVYGLFFALGTAVVSSFVWLETGGSGDVVLRYAIVVWVAATVIETTLLFVALTFVAWPRAPADRGPSAAAGPASFPDTCLLIACHDSCKTAALASRFRRVLQHALELFPPSAIFVCDNHDSPRPTDATEAICRELSPEINYVYIPEGNKTLSFYWVSEYWIPYLQSVGRCPGFELALIMDDDVLLPANLTLDAQTLRDDPSVAAYAFALEPATTGGQHNWWLAMQSIEYRLNSFGLYFQSQLGTALFAHGPIALWRRRALGDVLYRHNTVFHGEDMYNAFTLFRLRRNQRIEMKAGVVVSTFVPDNFLDLFAQRVNSWELATHRLSGTILRELLLHWQTKTLILKPYLLFHLLNNALDWFRVLFLVTGLRLAPLAMGSAIAGLFLLTWAVTVIFNQLALRRRPDLRLPMRHVAMFPVFRLLHQMFRLCGLVECIVRYVPLVPEFIPIRHREQRLADIPPTPPSPAPDWSVVYDAPAPEPAVPGGALARHGRRLLERFAAAAPNDNGSGAVRLQPLMVAWLLFERACDNSAGAALQARAPRIRALFRQSLEALASAGERSSPGADGAEAAVKETLRHWRDEEGERFAATCDRDLWRHICAYLWHFSRGRQNDPLLALKAEVQGRIADLRPAA